MYKLIHIHYTFTYAYNVETYANYKPLWGSFSWTHNISNKFCEHVDEFVRCPCFFSTAIVMTGLNFTK